MANIKIFIPVFLECETGVCATEGESLAKMYGRGRDLSPEGSVCGLTYERWSNCCRLLERPSSTRQAFARLPFADWCLALRIYAWSVCACDDIPSDGLAVCLADWSWVSGLEAILSLQRLLGATSPATGRKDIFVADGNVGRLTRLAIRRHLRTIPRRDELIGLLAQERLRLHPESGKRIDRVVALALSMDHANGDDDDM